MSGNNAGSLERHNSVSSLTYGNNNKRKPRPPTQRRNGSATPRTVRNQIKVRKNALTQLKNMYAKNNKNINKLQNLLKTIRAHKKLNTVSAYNVLALIFAQNAVLRARQNWKNPSN
jgi:hypothetical protein